MRPKLSPNLIKFGAIPLVVSPFTRYINKTFAEVTSPLGSYVVRHAGSSPVIRTKGKECFVALLLCIEKEIYDSKNCGESLDKWAVFYYNKKR